MRNKAEILMDLLLALLVLAVIGAGCEVRELRFAIEAQDRKDDKCILGGNLGYKL